MDSRTEGEIVRNAWALLDANQEKVGLDLAERIESRMSRMKLKALLESFKDSKKNAIPAGMDKLKEFLRARAERLIGTPALYCYQPTTLINRSCIQLAKDLTVVFPTYSILNLLLPMVEVPEKFESRYFNDFVVTSDGYLLPLLATFDKIKEDKYHRYYHPARRPVGKNSENETEYEKIDADLLNQHSIASLRYASSICTSSEMLDEADIAECSKARQELQNEFENDNYHRQYPAHGEEGKNLLILSFVKNIQTLQELAEFISIYAEKNEWEEFLTAIGRKELYRITSLLKQGEELDAISNAMNQLLKGAIPAPATEIARRAQNYILTFILQGLREERPQQYVDYLHGWGKTLFGQKSKDESVNYLKIYKEFLLGAHDKNIDKFIADKGLSLPASGATWYLKEKMKEASLTNGLALKK